MKEALSIAIMGAALLAPALRTHAVAQPPAAPESVEAESILSDTIRAYRSGPLAERVTITVSPTAGPERTSTAIIRTNPGQMPDDRALHIDIGVLRIYARGASLTVTRADDPSVCMRRTLSGPVSARTLSPFLPALALPQLQLALGDGAVAENLTPYSRVTGWRLDPLAPQGRLRLIGDGAGAGTSLVIDALTHRVRELSVRSPGRATLTVRCEPTDPGDPSSWALETDGRRAVRWLRDLGVPEPPLTRDEPVPPLPLQDLATDIWSLEDEFTARAQGKPARSPASAILLFTRSRPSDPARAEAPTVAAADGVRTYLRRLRRQAAEYDDTSQRAAVPFWRPVLVFDVEEFTRDRLAAAGARWKQSATAIAVTAFDDPEPECLWTSAGRPLLDRFVRGADVIVAAITPDGRLVGAISVTADDTRETVASRLAAMVDDYARDTFVGPPAPK